MKRTDRPTDRPTDSRRPATLSSPSSRRANGPTDSISWSAEQPAGNTKRALAKQRTPTTIYYYYCARMTGTRVWGGFFLFYSCYPRRTIPLAHTTRHYRNDNIRASGAVSQWQYLLTSGNRKHWFDGRRCTAIRFSGHTEIEPIRTVIILIFSAVLDKYFQKFYGGDDRENARVPPLVSIKRPRCSAITDWMIQIVQNDFYNIPVTYRPAFRFKMHTLVS